MNRRADRPEDPTERLRLGLEHLAARLGALAPLLPVQRVHQGSTLPTATAAVTVPHSDGSSTRLHEIFTATHRTDGVRHARSTLRTAGCASRPDPGGSLHLRYGDESRPPDCMRRVPTRDRDPASAATFGQRVRAARQARDFTQERLAERAGMHPTFIARVEAGSMNPTLSSIVRIAAALEMNPAELVDGLAPRRDP